MNMDFMISSDINVVLELPDQFNTGTLRHIIPEMVSGVYNQPRSLSEIISSADSSMRTIEREFKENIDCCPSDFLALLRVGICGCLLLWHNELTVDGIASVCGFCTGITLRRKFKKLTGLNPSEFKRMAKTGRRLPSMRVGSINAGWDVPNSIQYDSSGSIATPIKFTVVAYS